MPANHPPDGRRGDARRGDARRDARPATPPQRKAQLLFWAGMGLAPVAVLILLFGQSTGALRAAVALAVITIVLLAVSMAIRPTVDMVRVDIEHRVLDEMERIRLRARDESASVTHQSHRALSDHIHALNETIADLRAQVDEVQAISFFEPAGPAAIGPGPAGGPGVRRTETVHVTRRTTYDDTGTVYGSRSAADAGGRAVEGEWREREDRWGDQPWTARPEQRALPPADGEPAAYYLDERDDRYGAPERERHGDRDRYDDRGRVDHRGYDRDRGYERDRYDDRDRDRGYDRDRYDERGRADDRGYDRDRGSDRGYDRERDHVGGGYDRGYDRDRGSGGYERERGYDRDRAADRGYERDDDRGRGHDRYDDRDRGHDRDRPQVPRPRSSDW